MTRRLSPDVEPPTLVEVPFGHRLRPVRPDDADRYLRAVEGSLPRLVADQGWPARVPTEEEARRDLQRWGAEWQLGEACTYALLDADETALLGCVRVEPREEGAAGARASWWVVQECLGTDLGAALADLVPRWVEATWPPTTPLSGTRAG